MPRYSYGHVRILISYFFHDRCIPVGMSLADAFIDNQWEVLRFDCTIEHPTYRHVLKPLKSAKRRMGLRTDFEEHSKYGRQGYKRWRFFELLAQSKPDVVLVVKAHEFLRAEDVIRAKREFGVKLVVGWSVDGPNVHFDLDAEAQKYDLYYSTHKHGSVSSSVRRLPFVAVDKKRYFRWNSDFMRRDKASVLVSGWNPRRQMFVDGLVASETAVYGGWIKANRHNPEFLPLIQRKDIWGDDLRGLYNVARVALNIQGWDPRLDPCCNLRVMDIPACGALLVSEYSEELADYYKLGIEADSFRDPSEMIDKLSFYRNNPAIAARMAEAGNRKTQQLPTYTDKASSIIADIRRLL